MEAPRKVIVGLDLCDDFTQISCYSYKTLGPIAIQEREGEECPIPTVLCVKSDTKQWLFGDEAVSCEINGTGILIDHLLDKLRTGEITEVCQSKFTGVALLEKFLRKSLTLIKNHFPTEPITKLVVTLHNTEPEFTSRIYEVLELLGIGKDRAVVMNHAVAYLYYALSQDKSLWINDIGLFDYDEEGLKFYRIHINRRSKPMIAVLSKTDYTDSLNSDIQKQMNTNPAYIFDNIANTALYKQLITTLYFTGIGFDGGWADSVIKSLCAGRRVFFGQNMYTKGACYAAKELAGDRSLKDIILLNDEMVTGSVSIRVYRDAKFTELMLMDAGEVWYEVNRSAEVIPEGDAELEIVLKNILTKDVIREKLKLDNILKRPDRITRLEVNITCRDKATADIKITDLGFGEFFPATGSEMIYTIEIR